MLPLQLRGQLIAVFDERSAIESMRHGCKVIFIGDPVLMAEKQNYFISGAIFLPKVECMQSLVNGDLEVFRNMYMQQLYCEPMIHEFLDTIICAIYQGRTIIFYVPEIGYEFKYHEILFNFIHNVYGLYIQRNAQQRFFYEQGFLATIDALYNFKQINEIQYLAMIPDVKLDDPYFLSNRLCPMFHLINNDTSAKALKQMKMQAERSKCIVNQMITFGNTRED